MTTQTPRIANPDDAATITKLLKAFFSHEGRVVRHLQQNVEAILCDPGRGFFMSIPAASARSANASDARSSRMPGAIVAIPSAITDWGVGRSTIVSSSSPRSRTSRSSFRQRSTWWPG